LRRSQTERNLYDTPSFKDSLNRSAALANFGAPVEGRSAAQTVEDLLRQLSTHLINLAPLGASIVTLHLRLTGRLVTSHHWPEDGQPLPQLDPGLRLAMAVSTPQTSVSQILSRLTTPPLCEISVPLQAIEALHSRLERRKLTDLLTLANALEILWGDSSALVYETHAFTTARLLGYIIRGVSKYTDRIPRVLRLCTEKRVLSKVTVTCRLLSLIPGSRSRSSHNT
jgi:hypothetical protein